MLHKCTVLSKKYSQLHDTDGNIEIWELNAIQ
jgi:hypothetical protein